MAATIKVVRTIEYVGDPEWIESMMKKSLGLGIRLVAGGGRSVMVSSEARTIQMPELMKTNWSKS
jgi:hypothetical protein